MWNNVDKTIQIIESRIDLINRITDLYDPQYFSKDNEYFSLKYSHIVGDFVPMKEPHDFMYGFNYQCTSINEILSKLEGFLHSIRKNKSKTFPPLDNEFLHPSKNTTLTNYHIMYPMKQKDLFDYDPICIMSSGLMFDEIFMYVIRNNEFPHPTEENDCIFTQIENNIIYMYRRSLQDFYWKKGAYECLEIPCVHFHLKK